jgi:hypothetical protein
VVSQHLPAFLALAGSTLEEADAVNLPARRSQV